MTFVPACAMWPKKLFAARGPDAVTMRELADGLQVSSMTPYRYFKDKDAILAAVRTRAFNRFAVAMEAAGAGSKKQSGNAYLDFALANPAAYRLMFDVSQPTFADYPDLVKAMGPRTPDHGRWFKRARRQRTLQRRCQVGSVRLLVGGARRCHVGARGSVGGQQSGCANHCPAGSRGRSETFRNQLTSKEEGHDNAAAFDAETRPDH